MKKLSIVSLLLLTLVLVMSSCASSRSKYGCPGNPQANYKFRG